MKTGYDQFTPEGKKFLEEIKKLSELEVCIGFQRGKKQITAESTKGNSKKIDMVDIAAWNQVGTERIPARPFLTDSFDKHQDEIKKNMQVLVKGLLQGKSDAEKVLKRIGAMQKGYVQQEIREGDFVENAESYVKSLQRKSIKNGTVRVKDTFTKKPLILTGTMRQSVHFIVRKRGEQ